jgi:GLPGLI family protein
MESNDSGSLLEHWFYFDRTIYTIKDIQPAMPSSIIIQKPDGSREMLTDTILYAKDFANAKESILKARESIKQWIKIRNYDINILKEIQYDHNNIKYLLIDTLRKMTEWQLLDDTSFVLGIKCQKAITNFYGTNYTAWFTQLYPISAGPRNFRGLPGLILKVSNEKTGFSIEAVEIQYPAKQKSPRVEMDGKPISKSAFDAIIEKQNEASMRMLEQYTH